MQKIEKDENLASLLADVEYRVESLLDSIFPQIQEVAKEIPYNPHVTRYFTDRTDFEWTIHKGELELTSDYYGMRETIWVNLTTGEVTLG